MKLSGRVGLGWLIPNSQTQLYEQFKSTSLHSYIQVKNHIQEIIYITHYTNNLSIYIIILLY